MFLVVFSIPARRPWCSNSLFCFELLLALQGIFLSFDRPLYFFFWFWFTTQALYDSPASSGNYQLLITLNWQNFYRTRRMFENLKLDDYTRTHIQVTVLNVCCCDIDTTCCCPLNSVCSQYIPLTPMSVQDRISPHNIRTISGRQVMRIEKNIN